MIVLINAGGSGTRLWPLSTTEMPKQFLKIVGDKSLLQTAYSRALKITSADKIYVTTSQPCGPIVVEQLPDLKPDQIITEPARRDTMACVLNAFQYIASQTSSDEVIASIWSDNHIDDSTIFVQDILKAGDLSKKHKRIVLFGIVPDRPGPKFGHIHKAEPLKGEDNVFEVSGFKEKPDFELAKEYQESGEHLWNSGCFVASYSALRERVKKYSPPQWLDKLEELEKLSTVEDRSAKYLEFEREAVDIALMELTPDLLVIPQTFSWADLGSFDDVYAVNKKNQDENVINSSSRVISLKSKRNYVQISGNDKPVAILGLENIIVVDTPNGLLISHMNHAQLVKKITEELEE